MSALSIPSPDNQNGPSDTRCGGSRPEITWGEIAQRAPQMTSTMAAFLDQQSVSSRPEHRRGIRHSAAVFCWSGDRGGSVVRLRR